MTRKRNRDELFIEENDGNIISSKRKRIDAAKSANERTNKSKTEGGSVSQNAYGLLSFHLLNLKFKTDFSNRTCGLLKHLM